MSHYDYWITLPETPAFEDNINAAIAMVSIDGGTSPTIKRTLTGFKHSPANGTKANAGRNLLHFRLSVRKDETEIIAYLESAMTGTKPPLTVEMIQSVDLILPFDTGVPDPDGDGNVINMLSEIIVAPNKAKFLPFMNDIIDGYDGNDEPIFRSPTMSDTFNLSKYAGAPDVEIA